MSMMYPKVISHFKEMKMKVVTYPYRYRCEYCGKLIPDGKGYDINDQGETRIFCNKNQAYKFLRNKYNMKLPIIGEKNGNNQQIQE